MSRNQDRGQDRARIAREIAEFLDRGGTIEQAEPGRANPMNEDRHNSFLFLATKVKRTRAAARRREDDVHDDAVVDPDGAASPA